MNDEPLHLIAVSMFGFEVYLITLKWKRTEWLLRDLPSTDTALRASATESLWMQLASYAQY